MVGIFLGNSSSSSPSSSSTPVEIRRRFFLCGLRIRLCADSGGIGSQPAFDGCGREARTRPGPAPHRPCHRQQHHPPRRCRWPHQMYQPPQKPSLRRDNAPPPQTACARRGTTLVGNLAILNPPEGLFDSYHRAKLQARFAAKFSSKFFFQAGVFTGERS